MNATATADLVAIIADAQDIRDDARGLDRWASSFARAAGHMSSDVYDASWDARIASRIATDATLEAKRLLSITEPGFNPTTQIATLTARLADARQRLESGNNASDRACGVA